MITVSSNMEELMVTKYYIYELSPIDYWNGCVSLAQHLMRMQHSDYFEIEEFQAEIIKIAKMFCAVGNMTAWEGDIKEGVYVFSVPRNEVDMLTGYIWKQNNNGTTFCVSPMRLCWLDKDFKGNISI